MICAICDSTLTRDGCPNRLEHAAAYREAGFTPDPRGRPARPGADMQTHQLGVLNGPNANGLGRVVGAIISERGEQEAKWGTQSHSPARWLAILAEEFGEAAREAVDLEWPRPNADPASIRFSLREELVQVAAVAAAWLEDLDRQG